MRSFRLLLILFFVVIVDTLVKWLWGRNLPFLTQNRENALDILMKRYARGDISKDEFEKIKRDIE